MMSKILTQIIKLDHSYPSVHVILGTFVCSKLMLRVGGVPVQKLYFSRNTSFGDLFQTWQPEDILVQVNYLFALVINYNLFIKSVIQ